MSYLAFSQESILCSIVTLGMFHGTGETCVGGALEVFVIGPGGHPKSPSDGHFKIPQ